MEESNTLQIIKKEEPATIPSVENRTRRNSDDATQHAFISCDNEETTNRFMDAGEGVSMPAGGTTEAIFILGGRIYREIKTLSISSGEAQVMMVEGEGKRAVLKLYYPNFYPEEGVLQRVWNMNFPYIVHLYDYGQTIVDGVARDYELMELLEGISLAEHQIKGNEQAFAQITLTAAAALEYLHQCGMIHKDVKLGNYLFRDKEQTELVLTDFGISTIMGENEEKHKTTQARTPLYAAPEMYEDVIDGEVELTPKADFYSLGITLFSLWIGGNPFSGNERSMMRMKSEGRLPGLDKLPEKISRLIRGLTVVNPEKRWGYEEVERWFKGEQVEVDEASIYLKYKTFIVDSEKNVVASNASELAILLVTRKHLGIKYLYSKLISSWLEECGNRKMAIELDDIVETRYPLNPEAGIQAALYTLDKKMPYRDARGNTASGVHEVVMTLLANAEEYKVMLTDVNHPLYIYLEITTELEVNRLRKHFQKDTPEVALWRVIYELDPTIPFLADKPSATIEEIVDAFRDRKCRPDEWNALLDGRLLSWIYYKCDPMLYVEIKEICDEKRSFTRAQAYRVLYHLDKSRGFDLAGQVARHQVAAFISRRMTECQYCSDEEFKKQMKEYIGEESRLHHYAKMKGWRDVVELNKRTMDLTSEENTSRFGEYDIRTAAYRLCEQLGSTPEYYIRQTGRLITSYEEFNLEDSKAIRSEMSNGSLKQWLSIFFHENPHDTFSEKYSYEKRLGEFLTEVGKANPDDIHYRRFKHALTETRKKMESSRNISAHILQREDQLMKGFLASVILTLLTIGIFGYSNPEYVAEHSRFTIGLPLGGMTAIIATTWSYFHGNGLFFNLFWGIAGGISALLPAWIIKLIGGGHPTIMTIVSLIMLLSYAAIAIWGGKRKSIYKFRDLQPLFNENVNQTLLDPLYYTYKQKSFQFKGSNFKAIDEAVGVITASKVEFYAHYIEWILFMLTLATLFIVFHADLLNIDVPDIVAWKAKLGEMIKSFKASDLI
ncbi:MAG: protein kinase [Bacteroidaceae bacterium]|nr:protein kinase [Bacteroidaceae bacterium]